MREKIKYLLQEYQQNPCRLHACAIWKTLKNINDFHLVVNDKAIRIWNDTIVHLDYHFANPTAVSPWKFEQLNLLILHQQQMNDVLINEFNTHEEYFRLQYDANHFHEIMHGYQIKEVSVNSELETVSEFICQCYEDLKPSSDYFLRCIQEPVFDNHLWIWIIEPDTNKKVGLGIAEFDPLAGEGSLDWIQVFPDERGKGIGKIIVYELVKRLQTTAKIITVAGKSKAAEKLYRKCGFVGDDVWHVLTKQNH